MTAAAEDHTEFGESSRMFPGRDSTPQDVLDVLGVANLLGVGEFRLFELAYESWYGLAGDEKTIERSFLPYMFHDRVPHWVRAFTRRIERLEETGQLDPTELGIVPRTPTLRGRATGVVCALGIFAALAVLVALAKVTAESLGLADCLFPPCF